MNERIEAFSRMQIWFHKHTIHFMIFFVITGLPILAPVAFGWLAWFFGYPVGAVTGSTDNAAILSVGMQVARVVHRVVALLFALTVIPFVATMIAIRRHWEIGFEEFSIDGFKFGLEQLKRRYLLYTDARMGKYNIGQKMLAHLIFLGMSAMLVSGLMLVFRNSLPLMAIAGARFVHDFFFITMSLALIVHVYLATHQINRAGLDAIFGDGMMDAEEVKHHHPLWWAKLRANKMER